MRQELKYIIVILFPFITIVSVLVLLRLPVFADKFLVPKNAILVDKKTLTLARQLNPGWNQIWSSTAVDITQIRLVLPEKGCAKRVPASVLFDNLYLSNKVYFGSEKKETTFENLKSLRLRGPVWIYLIKSPANSDELLANFVCIKI